MTDTADARLRSKGVFISYRRGETSGQARALHELLSQRFGTARVFMDVDSIAPGADFVEKIEEAIGSSGVALVLIGRDWLSRGTDQHLLDDPSDFIRLETDTALRLGVPVIPILVERARMPSAGELPESLRPLTRRNALELENQRWEYDVGRLVRAVEQLVDATAAVRGPQPGADTRPIRSTETGTPVKETKKPSRSRRMSLAGLGVLVVVTAVVVFLLRPSGPMSVSAAHAVAAVPSDRLAGLLVETSFDSKDLPANVSASSPVLSSYRTPGLVDNVFVPFLGPAFDLSLHYMVFDSSAIASSFYANVAPLPEGYASTGQFHATGITDPTRCDTGREGAPALLAATWESSCAALSANVVSFVEVASRTNSTPADDNLAAALTRDAIRNLSAVAGAASTAAVRPPPGLLTPQELSERIDSTPLGSEFLPEGVKSSGVRRYRFGASPPRGLVAGSYITVALKGSGHRDWLYFYVFDTARQAQAFYAGLEPPEGYRSTGLIDSSGFSQPTSCRTYSNSSPTSPSSSYFSGCALHWGNVVVYTEAGLTQSVTPDENALAVTLARTAVIELDRLDSN